MFTYNCLGISWDEKLQAYQSSSYQKLQLLVRLLCVLFLLKILRITRKVLISFPGLTLLILGLLNWYWTIHGLNLVYSEYEGGALAGCTSFVHSVVWINLMITGLVSLPVVWVLFWMLIIKLTCILLGVISPSLLIKMKKFTA